METMIGIVCVALVLAIGCVYLDYWAWSLAQSIWDIVHAECSMWERIRKACKP